MFLTQTTWTLPDIVVSNTNGENLVTHHLPPHLSFPPPPLPLIRMDDKSSRPPRLDFTAPISDAAKALLSSPLPPELVVDFKGKYNMTQGNSLGVVTTTSVSIMTKKSNDPVKDGTK